MTLKKNELLCQSNYNRIFKMHVYTLVWLKSDRSKFLIVVLKHLDCLIDSHITPACIRSIRFDQIFAFCAGSRFFPGPWAGSRRTAASFLWNHHKQEVIVHLVCVIIVYTIYQMYKDVVSPCSSYAIFLECRGRVCCCWWCKEVSRRCFCYH